MIAAKFDAKCPGCGEMIYEGDKIGQLDGDWCCEQCIEDSGTTYWEYEQATRRKEA